jgi:hypothetical protein
MANEKPTNHERYIILLIAFFFVSALLCGSAGGIFETESKLQMSLYQFSSAFFIAGRTISFSKLTHEGWDIPASGFTILAISQGVYYASLLINPTDRLPFFSSGVPLFLPGIILISFYKLFPLWVRVFGILSCIPFLLILICTLSNFGSGNLMVILFILGFVLIDLSSLFWAFYFWRNFKKGIS